MDFATMRRAINEGYSDSIQRQLNSEMLLLKDDLSRQLYMGATRPRPAIEWMTESRETMIAPLKESVISRRKRRKQRARRRAEARREVEASSKV